MTRRTLFYILVGALLLAAAPAAFSQRDAAGVFFASDKPQPVADPEFNDRVMVARNLMTRREYLPASALLESLYQQYRSNEVVFNLLRDCYIALGFWPKLENLTRRFADLYPRHYRFQLYLGEALSKVGNKEESLAAYKKAIGLVGRNEEQAIGLVLDKMLADGHNEAAVTLIDSLRGARLDSTAFAMQRGIILEGHKRYAEAAMEFFSLLRQDHQLAVKAEKRIYSLLSFPESSGEVEKALLAQTETAANVYTFRVLSSYYLSVDNFDRAAYFAVKQDSADGYKGQPLVTFMRSCRDRKAWDQAVGMAEYILARYNEGPFLADTYFTYAEALTALGRYDEAVALYDSITVKFTHASAVAEAVYKIGAIYLDYLNLPEKALVYFDSVISHYPRGVPYLDALMAVPHAYLRQGDLKKSYAACEQLGKRQLSDDMMEQVDFHLALVLFFERQFDSARAGFQKLMVEYP
ncbi:MAG: tetratricopeptide repeat protein, partial [candidate division Zixibacteria bacterium]|nr:tetratricopeptide repeat protein [candidate division Zixibacteria bacterium]